MATIQREQISPWKTLSRGNFITTKLPEATSQSIVAGNMVRQLVDLTGGRVRKAGATSPNASLGGGIRILGVMNEPFNNRSATSENVGTMPTATVATRDTVFKIHVSNNRSNASLTRALVGSTCGLINLSNSGGSGIWCANIAQTSIAASQYVRIVELIDAVADVNGAVGVTFGRQSLVYGS